MTDVRLARPTVRLAEQERFYDAEAGLSRLASFRDHHGYSGTIWRLGIDGPQFELCAGPDAPVSGAGWSLEAPDDRDTVAAGRDPEGFAWLASSQVDAPTGVRPTSRPERCRDFYERVLGLPVRSHPHGMTVALPAGRGLIRLEPVATAPRPTVEDMLVFYFAHAATRDHLARRLLDAGAPAVRPENPWWHRRARCVSDPDGTVLALAAEL